MRFEWFEMPETDDSKLSVTERTEASDTRMLEQGLTLERLAAQLEITEATEQTDTMIGTPEKDMENWHKQESNNSCAICVQEMVGEQLLGKEFSEKEFTRIAEKNGWVTEESGTLLHDVGKILEMQGLDVERSIGATLQDLAEDLQSGSKPICAVNIDILYNPEMEKIPGIRANHVVEVIGIDVSDPNDIKVILNDTGVSDGRGCVISAETFMKAWNKSDNFVATVSKGA